MPELFIKVTTEDAKIRALVDALNKGEISLGAFNKQMRELKNAAIPGSQALKDLNDVQNQVTQGSKSAEAQERSLTTVIRQARQERRLYMFAITESLSVIQTAVGGQNRFTSAIMSGTSAAFGMRFALDALGGRFAALSGPIGIAVGLFSFITSVIGSARAEVQKLRDEIAALSKENYQKRVELGLVTPGQNIADMQKDLNQALKERTKLLQTPERTGGGTYDIATGGIKQGEIDLERKKKIEEYDKKIFELEQSIDKARMESANKLVDSIDAFTAANGQAYDETKKRRDEDQKEFLDSLAARAAAFDLMRQGATIGNAGTMAGPGWRKAFGSLFTGAPTNVGPVPLTELQKLPGISGKNTGLASTEMSFGAGLTEELKKAKTEANTFTDSLTQGLTHATTSLAQGFTSSFKLGNSLLGQFAASMLSVFSEIGIKAMIGKGLSMIPGLGFLSAIWPHAEGGWLNEPVIGMGMRTGQLHSFAEKGPEYISNVNQMGQAGRYGGEGQSIAAALQSIEWRIKGLDIVATYDKNKPVRLQRNW